MFSKFPVARKRKNVFIYFPGTPRDSIAGDQDLLSIPSREKELAGNVKMQQLVAESQKWKSLHQSQEELVKQLKRTIATKNEEIETLKKIPKPTVETQAIDGEIAKLRVAMDDCQTQQNAVTNAYRNSQQTVQNLHNNLKNVLNSIESGIGGSIPSGETIESVLRTLRDDMSKATNEKATLFSQNQQLTQRVAALTKEMEAAKKTKDDIIRQEQEKYAAINTQLQQNKRDLAKLEEDYLTCARDKDSSGTTISQLRRELKDKQDSCAAYEKTCKEQLQKLVDDARERANKLQDENKVLLDRLDQASKAIPETAEVVKKSDKDLLDECDKKRKEIATMTPFLKRQTFIFDIATSTAGGSAANANWKLFADTNGSLYALARKTIQRFEEEQLGCQDIIDLHTAMLDVYERLRNLDDILVNLYEDAAGAVRVYIRLRPLAFAGTSKSTTKQGKSVIYNGNLCGNPIKTYGRFFGVIPDTFSNVELYSGCKGTKVDANLMIRGHDEKEEQGQTCCLTNDASGLCRVMNQLRDGYHVVLFGYGLSGSGKTHSLLGGLDADGNPEPGIVQLSIANSQAEKVYLRSVFELAYDRIDFRSKNFNSGKFVELFHRGDRILKNIPQGMGRSEEADFASALLAATKGGMNIPDVKKEPLTAQDMYNIRQVLDAYRVNRNRIKATPNNPQSSRSHLFITLEYQFKRGMKGYLTIIDMGGRESSLEVLEMFLEKPADKGWQLTSLLMNNPTLYPAYLRPHVFRPQDATISWIYDDARYKSDLKYAQTVNLYVTKLNAISSNIENVIDVVKESVFINETINQLILFFRMKQDPTRDSRSFNMKEMRFPLDDRKNPYDPLKFLTGIPSVGTDRMGMTRILTILSTLFNKPSKFVMICNVRQEAVPAKFCTSTRETLDFAHSIRST